MKLRIADGEYRNSFHHDIQVSEFAYSPKDQCLVFTLGISDGFYPSNYETKIPIQRIVFHKDYILIMVEGKQNVPLLAEEIAERNAHYAKTRSSVRM
ncbi:hypothetical protein [Rubripirellula reticaptiva]|uniref:Uncharacterized protein n=1 Tax=Rubripirellula reticaptiva TaxID=2528013 RepID=A0A5C6EJW2_9BACT|nr:hypothetical protein [Rubripirellula reticaptiva]TWU49342.1 hypothetical protein Poly59_39560 [Rubripirellula reticaptiva]